MINLTLSKDLNNIMQLIIKTLLKKKKIRFLILSRAQENSSVSNKKRRN